jgi:hypothetical protein
MALAADNECDARKSLLGHVRWINLFAAFLHGRYFELANEVVLTLLYTISINEDVLR